MRLYRNIPTVITNLHIRVYIIYTTWVYTYLLIHLQVYLSRTRMHTNQLKGLY